MASEWIEYQLDQVTELIVDCPHSTPEWADHGILVLRNQYIKNGRLDLSNPSYTNEKTFLDRIRRATPSEGDLVLTREAPMGEVCRIPANLKCCLGQRMVLIRTKKELLDSGFLLYAIQAPYIQHQISWNEGTGTTVSNIRIPYLKALKVLAPDLTTQKAIAHILGTLDDKIELNRQMNATLEAMAQALFKSWFVDFDPVIDNALAAGHEIPEPLQARAEARAALGDQRRPLPEAIQQQFPNRFVLHEEMGWVPEGWEVTELKQTGEIICGKTPSKKNPDFFGDDIPFIKIPDMHNEMFVVSPSEHLSKLGANSQPKKNIPSGSICVSCIATVGKVIITNQIVQTNQQINSIIPKNKKTKAFLYFKMLSLNKVFHDLASAGSATLNMNTGTFSKIKILLPSESALNNFHEKTDLLLKKIELNQLESVSLSRIRYTLLPQLLSGQLRVSEAEQLIAEAL